MRLVISGKTVLGKNTIIKLVIMMLLIYYLPTYLSWLLLVLLTLFDGDINHKDLNKYFRISVLLIAMGAFVGAVNLIWGLAALWPFARDIIRVSILPLTIIWSQKMARKMGKDIYRALYVFCGICVLIGFFQVLISGGMFFSIYESVRAFRQKSFVNEFILSMGVFLFMFRKKIYGGNFFSTFTDMVIGIICIAGVGVSFSRTALVLIICLLVFQIKDIKRTLGVVAIVCIIIALLIHLAPSLLNEFLGKISSSLTEISESNSWTPTNIVLNWRGYEIYCAKTQFVAGNIFEKIFGIGYGRGIDGRGYSYLVIDEPTIPWLHNGYYTTLVKLGVVGCIFVAGYWLKSIKELFTINDIFFRRFYCGMIIGLIVSMIAVTGIFWGGVPFVYFFAIFEIIQNKRELKGT